MIGDILDLIGNGIDSFFSSFKRKKNKTNASLSNIKIQDTNYDFSPEEKNDYEIVMENVKKDGTWIKFATKKYQMNTDIVIAAINQNSNAAHLLSLDVLSKPEVMKKVLPYDGDLIRFSGKLKYDKEYALLAVKNRGSSYQYLPDCLKNDKDIICEAIQSDPDSFIYFSRDIKEDRNVVAHIVSKRGYYLKEFPKYQGDEGIVILAITSNPFAYEFATEKFKNDKEFLISAMLMNVDVYNMIQNKLFFHDLEILCIKDKKYYLLLRMLKNERFLNISFMFR